VSHPDGTFICKRCGRKYLDLRALVQHKKWGKRCKKMFLARMEKRDVRAGNQCDNRTVRTNE